MWAVSGPTSYVCAGTYIGLPAIAAGEAEPHVTRRQCWKSYAQLPRCWHATYTAPPPLPPAQPTSASEAFPHELALRGWAVGSGRGRRSARARRARPVMGYYSSNYHQFCQNRQQQRSGTSAVVDFGRIGGNCCCNTPNLAYYSSNYHQFHQNRQQQRFWDLCCCRFWQNWW